MKHTKYIYEPSGKAREYSPLALNFYLGCDHLCQYCYSPQALRGLWPVDGGVKERIIQMDKLMKDCEEAADLNEQVLLSFVGDPYCIADVQLKQTMRILTMFKNMNVPTAVLTKGGMRSLRDLPLFRMYPWIKVGASLTFDNIKDSKIWEMGAASPLERMTALDYLHHAGVKTWASMEPVIDPSQSISLIQQTLGYVDHYMLGKLNHHKEIEEKIDWEAYGNHAMGILDHHQKDYYVKDDLAQYLNIPDDSPHRDKDRLNVRRVD